MIYSKFGNFPENVIIANSIKRYINDVKNSLLWQDLPTSINDKAILPFRKGFIFAKLRICEVLQKFPNLQYATLSAPKINADGEIQILKNSILDLFGNRKCQLTLEGHLVYIKCSL